VGSAELHYRLARSAFGDLYLNAWMPLSIMLQKSSEEAARDQSVNTDSKTPLLTAREHAGGSNGLVELIDCQSNAFDKVPARLCDAHASRVAFEEKNTKLFFQHFHARADTRLSNSKRIGRVTEIQMLSDSECLNK